AHPALVRVRRLFARVIVRNPRVMVVARIGVAAVAIGRSARERLFVIALNAGDSALDQQLRDAVGMRTERAEVAEEEGRVTAAPLDVVKRGDESVVIRVDP